MPGIQPTYVRRVINWTTKYTPKGPKKQILSETTELVPKNNSNKLSETVYHQVFDNGKLAHETQTRTVFADPQYGTRAVFESKFDNPKAPQKRIETTDRTFKKFEAYGYGYGNENMKRLYERDWSKDGSYITREHSVYDGCINAPNCHGSRTDFYNKDAHLHYIDGQLYRTNPPVFYNNHGQVTPKNYD